MRTEIVADLSRFGTRFILSTEVRLHQILESISRNVGGTRSIVIGDSSGLPVISLDKGANTMAATAMATLALSAARNVSSNLDLPDLSSVTIEGRGWRVFVRSLDPRFTLFIVTADDVDPAFVKAELERHAPELRRILAAMGVPIPRFGESVLHAKP